MWFLALMACNFEAAPKPGDTAEVVFDVPSGSTARGLGDELEDEGLVTSADNWGWFLRLGADGSCLKAGKHRVNRGMTATELLGALCGVPLPDDVPFTVVEGWRRRDIDAALVAQKLIEPGAFIAATEQGSDYSPGFLRRPARSKATCFRTRTRWSPTASRCGRSLNASFTRLGSASPSRRKGNMAPARWPTS